MSDRPAISAKSFDHVTIICANLEATRRFYVDFLGMKQVPRPAFKFPGTWFELGRMQIHATQQSAEAGKAGWANQGNTVVSRGHHLAFAVDDVTATLKTVEVHGVKVASPLQQRPDGFRPDGHVIELVSS
jgi:glyoxylase I family protein